MSRVNRSNGRGGSRNGPRSVNAQLGALKSSLHGHANRLTATNPPPFTRKPFNTITVEHIEETAATDLIFSISDCVNALREQLDVATALQYHVTIKIKRIDLWAIGGLETTPTVRATFFGLTPQVSSGTATQVYSNAQKSLEDIGTPGASAAVVSYTYPRDQSDLPLSPAIGITAEIPLVRVTTQANTKCYMRFHLLWNTAKPFELVQPVAPAA